MDSNPMNSVSVLLICAPGLIEKSLLTTVNAVPLAVVVANTTTADSALRLAQQLQPDVLLADATSRKDEVLRLLKLTKKMNLKVIYVVLTTASVHKNRFFQEGADFVLDDRNLDQEFTEILGNIQAYLKNRPSP